MKTLFLNFILFLLFLFSSCSDDSYTRSTIPGPQEETGNPPVTQFSTRLTNNLLISGIVCAGGEQTDIEGETHTCLAGDYLVTVDNINSCTPDGCTEVHVVPVIAALLSTGSNGTDTTFFDIVPSIPVNEQTETILEDVQVRSRNGENVVLFK